MRKQIFLLLVLLFLTGSALSANSIGAVPGTYDFGEVERGETVEGTFQITTNIESVFGLEPRYSHPIGSVYDNEDPDFNYNLSEASQQNMSDWVSFDQSRFEVDPDTSEEITLSTGSTVNSEGKVTFEVHVPNDAEPGYHIGQIDLNPDVDSGDTEGSALLNIGLTNAMFVLEVPEKEVDRELEIMRLNGVRLADDLARTDILVRNTGETTVQVVNSDVEILEGESSVGEARIGSTYIAPGEVEVLEPAWRGENVSEGVYKVKTQVDYISDEIPVDQLVEIPAEAQDEPVYKEVSEDDGTPWILILIIVAAILLLLIYLEIEIKWSVLIAAVVAAVLYLLL